MYRLNVGDRVTKICGPNTGQNGLVINILGDQLLVLYGNQKIEICSQKTLVANDHHYCHYSK